jgi:hypothetical protein
MNPDRSPSQSDRPSWLALDKSALIIWVTLSLLLVETFSGALRFYFEQMGMSALLYLPKAACVLLIAVQLTHYQASRAFWLGLLLLLISSQLALLHGASLSNIGFSLFMYSPLLFGLVCGEQLARRQRLLCWGISLLLLAALLGMLLDKFTDVPWKGYSYSIGGTEISANMAWSSNGTDRIAGFSRMSSSLAMLIAIFSLYLAAFTRSKALLLGLFAVSFYGILLSTNKSTAAAFLFTLLLLAISRYRLTCSLIFGITVLVGLALPAISLLSSFNPHAAGSGALASIYDRLVNTWPNLIAVIVREEWSLWGAGFGMVGNSAAMLPVAGGELLSVADNTALYLWATFGIAGLLLYGLLWPLLYHLREQTSRLGRALLSISFCCVLISWTTDVLEMPIATLFLGLAIAYVLRQPTPPIAALDGQRGLFPEDFPAR